MLEARQLTKRYGQKLIFRDLNLTVESGIAVAVLGANGAGKSTLLKIIAGLTRPTAGTVTWDGKALQWQCGLAAPDTPIYHELTVQENLQFFARGRGDALDAARLEAHLENFALRERRHDLVKELSSGLRARVQLAVATLHGAPVLLLDEPSANLDSAGRELLGRVVTEQRSRGVVLLATNDTRDLDLCDGRIEL